SDELGVIFSLPPQDTNDVETNGGKETYPFILQDHKLGVSMHCLHPLISEARAQLFPARDAYLRTRNKHISISGSGIGTVTVNKNLPTPQSEGAGKPKLETTEECPILHSGTGVGEQAISAMKLMSITRALLLVNADHVSAWNARKLVIQDGSAGGVDEEIKVRGLETNSEL
ncbi:unnamed protein product, partial [Choristocarpus tenellus]